jgi:hypothetical protein
MATKVSEVVLKMRFDDASLAKSAAEARRFAGIIESIGGTSEGAQKKIAKLLGTAEGLDKSRAVIALANDFYDLAISIKDPIAGVEHLVASMKEIGADADQIALATAEFERLAQATKDFENNALADTTKKGGLNQSIFSKVQRAAGGVGLGGVADIAGFADDFADLGSALSSAGVAVAPLVASLSLLAAPIGLIGLAIAGFIEGIKKGAKDIDAAIQQLDVYYDTIGEGTTASINAQIDKINKQKSIDQQYAEQIQRTQDLLRSGSPLDAVGQVLFKAAGGADGLQKKADELAQKLKDADLNVAGLTAALSSSAVASNDAAEAAKNKAEIDQQNADAAKQQAEESARQQKALLDKQTDQQADAIRKQIALDAQLDELKAKGSSAQVAEQAQAINQLAIQREKELNALYALPNQTESVVRQIEDLEQELQLLDYQAARLEGDVKKTVDARQAELDAYAKLQKSVADLTAGLQGATGKAASLAKGVLEAVGKAGEDRLKVEEKAADDIAKINESALEKKADLEKRFADRQIDITEQAAESASKALSKLKQSQVDLKRDLDRDTASAARKQADSELQARIDYAREDEKALRDHLANLQKIRTDAEDREFELASNRDFAGLFFSRRDTNRQLGEANSSFGADRQQRQQELQAQLEDGRRQAAIESRERQIQYQQRIADARVAYQRESAEIEANRQQQLAKSRAQYAADQAELSAALAKQLAARRAAYRLELDEINKALALRLKAEFNAQSGLIQGAQRVANVVSSIFSAIGGFFKQPVKRALGGGVNAFQPAIFNETGSSGLETVRTGGRTFGSNGPSVFVSSQPAYVNANRGGASAGPVTISPTFNISGAQDPQAIAAVVDKRMTYLVKQIIKR